MTADSGGFGDVEASGFQSERLSFRGGVRLHKNLSTFIGLSNRQCLRPCMGSARAALPFSRLEALREECPGFGANLVTKTTWLTNFHHCPIPPTRSNPASMPRQWRFTTAEHSRHLRGESQCKASKTSKNWEGPKKPVDELIADLAAVPEAVRRPGSQQRGRAPNHTFF